jgi:hypothetical protein
MVVARRCLGRNTFSTRLLFKPLNIRRLLYKNIESINKSFIRESFFSSFNYIDSSFYRQISRDLAYFVLFLLIYALIVSPFQWNLRNLHRETVSKGHVTIGSSLTSTNNQFNPSLLQ